ncbi:MAG: hypothetical protein ABIV50_15740 [Opitutus sp.]
MQRDYLLRIIDQVALLLVRAIRQREASAPQEGLQSIMAACERLFGMEAVQLFQFTPDQHVEMLAQGEEPESAHDKIMIYARLNQEAGACYARLGQANLAQQSLVNALRLSLKAKEHCPGCAAPDFAPDFNELMREIGNPTDPETTQLITSAKAKLGEAGV